MHDGFLGLVDPLLVVGVLFFLVVFEFHLKLLVAVFQGMEGLLVFLKDGLLECLALGFACGQLVLDCLDDFFVLGDFGLFGFLLEFEGKVELGTLLTDCLEL